VRANLILTCLVLAACQGAEPPGQAQARMRAEADAALPQIQAQMATYVRAAASGNVDSMLSVYTSDAVVMPPNRPLVQGAAALRALVAGTGPFQVTLRTSDLTVNGPVAIERGTWTAVMSPPGTPMAVMRDGKYLAHWRLEDGAWRMAAHIWNDDYRPME
jgi:ketosteroid isomerase-like protein